jgi:hypothetical protein
MNACVQLHTRIVHKYLADSVAGTCAGIGSSDLSQVTVARKVLRSQLSAQSVGDVAPLSFSPGYAPPEVVHTVPAHAPLSRTKPSTCGRSASLRTIAHEAAHIGAAGEHRTDDRTHGRRGAAALGRPLLCQHDGVSSTPSTCPSPTTQQTHRQV